MRLYLRREFFGSCLFNPTTGQYFSLGGEDTRRLEDMCAREPSCLTGDFAKLLGTGISSAEPVVLTSVTNPVSSGDTLSAPFKAFFNVTKRCNLHCRHCYNSSGEAESAELEYGHVSRTLTELERHGIFKVTLSGGEPFVHKDIEAILSHLAGTDLWISIVSNGTLLAGRLVSLIASVRNVRSVTVSLDGATDADNDAVRGHQAYARAINGLQNLVRAYSGAVAVRVTLMRPNVERITQLPQLLVHLGVREIKVNPGNPYGRAKNEKWLLLTEPEYREARQRLHDEADKYGIIVEVPSFKYQRTDDDQVGLCRAGQETCEIDGDGEVYPCSFSFGRFSAGNVRRSSFTEILMKLQRHSINNEWCYSCKGRGGTGEKVFGYVPKLVERLI